MNSTRISYTPCGDISPEQARDARARAWAFVFQCWQKKQKAAPASRPDTRKEEPNASGKASISR
jgi:hypothetical protein